MSAYASAMCLVRDAGWCRMEQTSTVVREKRQHGEVRDVFSARRFATTCNSEQKGQACHASLRS